MFCLCSLLGVLWCHVLHLSLQALLNLFLCMVWGYVLVSLIYMQLSSFPSTTFWRLFPILYSCLFCQRLKDPSYLVFFLGSLLIHMSDHMFHWSIVWFFFFLPVPHCLDYYSFVILSEVWKSYASCFFPHNTIHLWKLFYFLGKQDFLGVLCTFSAPDLKLVTF